MERIIRIFIIIITVFLIANSLQSQAMRQHDGITRPEDRGENFKSLDNESLIKELSNLNLDQVCYGINHLEENCIKLRKIAQVLGDRYLNRTLNLNEKEKIYVNKCIEHYILFSVTNDLNDQEEAAMQMHRFYKLSFKTLKKYVGHSSEKLSSFATQRLIEMRDKSIIEFFIVKAREAKSSKMKKKYSFILKLMNHTYKPLVPNRTFMDEATTREVYARLVEPAIRELDKEIAVMKN